MCGYKNFSLDIEVDSSESGSEYTSIFQTGSTSTFFGHTCLTSCWNTHSCRRWWRRSLRCCHALSTSWWPCKTEDSLYHSTYLAVCTLDVEDVRQVTEGHTCITWWRTPMMLCVAAVKSGLGTDSSESDAGQRWRTSSNALPLSLTWRRTGVDKQRDRQLSSTHRIWEHRQACTCV